MGNFGNAHSKTEVHKLNEPYEHQFQKEIKNLLFERKQVDKKIEFNIW